MTLKIFVIAGAQADEFRRCPKKFHGEDFGKSHMDDHKI